MKKLEQIILDRIDDESLYLLYRNYPSMKIDNEWKRRLVSCDPDIYVPLLDFFISNNIPKTLPIKQGLYELRNCFPWKIGVIYDFQTGQVKSIEIRIGKIMKKYHYNREPILFSWLDANESKKLLREIISSNTHSSQFSIKMDNTKSVETRDLILDNKILDLEVVVLKATHRAFRSFPHDNPLAGGENFVVYPYSISDKNKKIKLYENQSNESTIVKFSNIPITYSLDVQKYLSVIS